MTPRAFAQYMNGVPNALEYEIMRAEADNLRHAHELAVIHSSGPINSAQLAAEDHPFAVRHGSPLRDPSVINVQSGAFVHAWEQSGPRRAGGRLVGTVRNTDYKAQWLDYGTARMFARPLVARVLSELAPQRIARLVQAIADGLR